MLADWAEVSRALRASMARLLFIRAYYNQILTPTEVQANYGAALTPGTVILVR